MALDLHPDWYLREWLDYYEMSQADLMRLTDWDRRKTSFLVSGQQPYKRGDVVDAARALNLAPYELLISPDQAFAFRRMKADARLWVAERPAAFAEQEPEPEQERLGPSRIDPSRKAS